MGKNRVRILAHEVSLANNVGVSNERREEKRRLKRKRIQRGSSGKSGMQKIGGERKSDRKEITFLIILQRLSFGFRSYLYIVTAAYHG